MTTMTEVHESEIRDQITPETDTSKSSPLPLVQPLRGSRNQDHCDFPVRDLMACRRARPGLWECEMGKEHTYRVTAWWTAGQAGLTKSESAPNAVHFTAPPQFGGMKGRWTPEDLLLSAVASCFTTTFHAVAGSAKFEYTDLEVEVEGTVDKTQTGYRFTRIVIRPTLMISEEQEQTRASDLLKRAKSLCLIARALATAQEFEPLVRVGTMV